MKKKFVSTGMAMVALGAVLFTGCGINENATLVTIDGKDTISLGYGNFAARYTQSMYDTYYLSYMGEQMWSQEQDGSTMEESVKDGVLDMMQEAYIMKQHAEEYDVTISEKEQKAITKAAKAFMKENDEATLEEMCATQEIVEEYLTYQTYAYKVEEAVKAAAKVSVKDEDAAQKTISYVCFSTEAVTDETGNTVELTEEELKQIKEDAKTLAQTEDFDATAEALEQKVQTAHYGKKDETLADAVKEAADALAEGEISSVVEVEGTGYYVIRLDAAFDEEATAEEKASLEEEQRSAYFTDKMEEWKKEMDWKVDKKQWKKVTFDSLFQAPQTQND